MNRRIALTVGVAALSATAVAAAGSQTAKAANPEVEKIRALLAAHDKALTNHDMNGVLASLADDASVMGTGPGEMWTGTEELRLAYEHFFMVFDKGEQSFDYQFRVAKLSSDMGWMMASGNVSAKREGKSFSYPLNVSMTVAKSGDDWKIAAMHFSTLTGEADVNSTSKT